MCEEGTLETREVEPLDLSADEFAANVRREVEEAGATMVMIDGVSGYRMSARSEEETLIKDLHSLCRYYNNMGVTVMITDDVGGVTGQFGPTSARISYLVDNILSLRYLVLGGESRKATDVLKKRTSDIERTLREFSIAENGVQTGELLTNVRGVLTGTPEPVEDGE